MVSTWNARKRNSQKRGDLINACSHFGVHVLLAQEVPTWDQENADLGYTTFSYKDNDCAIIYCTWLEQFIKRRFSDSNFTALQIDQMAVVSVHLPCGRGRLLG